MSKIAGKLRHVLVMFLVLTLAFGNVSGVVLAETGPINEGITQENETTETITVTFRVEGISETLLKDTEIEINKDKPNALDVTKKALNQAEIPFELGGNIIFKIGDDEQSAFETWDGWNYMVNDVHPDVMSDEYPLNEGDEVVWFYGNEVDIYEGYDDVDEIDKLTLRSNLSVDSNLVEDQAFEVKVTGTYDVYDMLFELKESGLKTPIKDVDVSFNNKTYLTDQNGVAKIPGEDAKFGEYEIRIAKDIENSYPRILRKSKKVIIHEKEDANEDSGESTEPEVNKSVLKKAIADSKSISVEGKTKESVKLFKAAVAKGKVVQENEESTQLEVENAIKAIQTAIEGLKESPEENPDSQTEKELKEKLNKSVESAIGYAEKHFPDFTDNKSGSHSDYWAFSALWGAGIKDLEKNFSWKGDVSPSASHTFWEQKLSKANKTSNDDAGTIIGSVILGQSPYDFGTRDIVADLEAKQKENGSFSTIWGEPWAMIALELVDSDVYEKDKHVDHVLSFQHETGMFGGADLTGWILTALAPYKGTHPAVKEAVDKSIDHIHKTYKETGKLPGKEDSNSITSLYMGLAANGENLLSNKWTNDKNIVLEFIEAYQFEDGSFAWQSGSTTGSLRMTTEQVILGLATVKEQESIFTQLKAEKNNRLEELKELKELILKAKQTDVKNKTNESIMALDKAIASAKKVLVDKSATQKDIDTAIKALNKAIKGLTEVSAVDFSKLDTAIEAGNKADITNKTTASVEALNKAIKKAMAILADDASTIAEIDQAVKELEAAIAGLVNKSTLIPDKKEVADTSKDKGESKKDDKLPQTSTNNYTFILVGFIILILGAIFLIRSRKVN